MRHPSLHARCIFSTLFVCSALSLSCLFFCLTLWIQFNSMMACILSDSKFWAKAADKRQRLRSPCSGWSSSTCTVDSASSHVDCTATSRILFFFLFSLFSQNRFFFLSFSLSLVVFFTMKHTFLWFCLFIVDRSAAHTHSYIERFAHATLSVWRWAMPRLFHNRHTYVFLICCCVHTTPDVSRRPDIFICFLVSGASVTAWHGQQAMLSSRQLSR